MLYFHGFLFNSYQWCVLVLKGSLLLHIHWLLSQQEVGESGLICPAHSEKISLSPKDQLCIPAKGEILLMNEQP